MNPSEQEDTIFACATPPGRSAIAVLRLSGPKTDEMLQKLCRDLPAPRLAAVRTLYGNKDNAIDDALVLRFKAPASYTGEDGAELHVHGNPRIVAQLEETLQQNGVRLAAPGEFTRRAVDHGKLDLTQAEGVRALIDAQSDEAVSAGRLALAGAISSASDRIRTPLVQVLAQVEARVDFPDEEIHPEETAKVMAQIKHLHDVIEQIIVENPSPQSLTRAATVVIAGPPNTGKSTLLNQLIGYERALVSDTAGTTRDWLDAHGDLDGMSVRWVDTAGLRQSDDPIETAGMAAVKQQSVHADLVLWLHDLTAAETSNPPADLAELPRLDVYNKCDLVTDGDHQPDGVIISAKNGSGLDSLRTHVRQRLHDSPTTDSVRLVSARQRTALVTAGQKLQAALVIAQPEETPELIADHIYQSLAELEALVGKVDRDADVLDAVFSSFCIGK